MVSVLLKQNCEGGGGQFWTHCYAKDSSLQIISVICCYLFMVYLMTISVAEFSVD
jgi:hypothetical protein